jgi:hypothetical protein
MFRRTARWCAYAIAGLSLLYAAVFLGLVRTDPANSAASALANGFIALSGIFATFAVVAVGDRVDGAAGRWVRTVGVGWALLSAAHGAFSAIADAQGIAADALSATDPRGLATFGLAGLWSIVLGLAIRSGTSFPRTLGTVALVNGADLIVLFFATATGAGALVLLAGGLASVILGPLQWAWIGREIGDTLDESLASNA